jgi:hypothetical protein
MQLQYRRIKAKTVSVVVIPKLKPYNIVFSQLNLVHSGRRPIDFDKSVICKSVYDIYPVDFVLQIEDADVLALIEVLVLELESSVL